MQGRVSIITPSFNRGFIVDETAQSIFAQTYENWEWVIVDDGSTDNSWELLESYTRQDDRVKIFKRDREPKGACTCRNIAVERCTGEYVMFLDTDDLLAPFCLEQRVAVAQKHSDCDFVIFPMLIFKKEKHDLSTLWNIDSEKDDLMRLLTGDPVCQGTGTLWKKESFVQVGMWHEELKLWQDIELHIRSLLYPVKYVKRLDLQPDVYLRVSEESLSRTNFYSEPKMKSRAYVYQYACDEIVRKGLIDKYREGLRVMGYDVLLSSVNSHQFDLSKELMRHMHENGIMTTDEQAIVRKYMQARKVKLYKLPALFNPLVEKVKNIVAEQATTLNKIKWENSSVNQQ